MPSELKKTSAHVGIGLVAGVVMGVAAGLFLQSKKGKEMLKDAEKKAMVLQKKLLKELKNVESLTKEKYAEIVEKMVEHYVATKDIAKAEVPEIRKFLLKKWTQIDKQLKSLE